MRKISLTRSALVTGCILISSIPLQGKAKNLFLEQGIQSFSGHARTDTRVAYKEKRDTLIQNDHTLLIAGQFVENDTLFFVQEYDREDGEMSRNTYIFLEPDRQSEYFQPDYWINRFEGNHEDYLQQIKEHRNYHLKNNGTPYQKVNTFGLPADWIPLHYFDRKPYAYIPPETDTPAPRRLTDSLLIQKDFEIYTFPLRESRKLSPTLYHFRLEETDLFIHILDEQTQTAVWEYRQGKKNWYHLMIPVASVRYFDLMHSITPNHKYFETHQAPVFDSVNIKALLQQKQQSNIPEKE